MSNQNPAPESSKRDAVITQLAIPVEMIADPPRAWGLGKHKASLGLSLVRLFNAVAWILAIPSFVIRLANSPKEYAAFRMLPIGSSSAPDEQIGRFFVTLALWALASGAAGGVAAAILCVAGKPRRPRESLFWLALIAVAAVMAAVLYMAAY